MAEAKVGQQAPAFDMPSTKNIEKLDQNVKLSDYEGKWLVLLFYPLDFTFVCPTELTTFSDRYEDFLGIGADEGEVERVEEQDEPQIGRAHV